MSDNEMEYNEEEHNEEEHNEEDDFESIKEDDTDSDLELDEICPLRDDAKVLFHGHGSGILSLDLDDKRNIVYTGGLDDKVMIWQLNTGRLIAELIGHKDSVTHIRINSTGSILASGDMNGCVILWRRVKNEERWEQLHEIETATIVELKWSCVKGSELLYICDAVGTVQSWSMQAIAQGPSMYRYGQGCSCSKYCLVLNDEWSAVLYGESCSEHEDCGNTSSLHLNHNGSERSVKVDLKYNSTGNEDDQADEGLGAGWANKAVAQAHMLAIGDWGQMIVASVTGQGYNTLCKLTRVPIKDGGLVDNVAFAPQMPYVAFSTKLGLMGVYDLTKQSLRYMWNYGSTMPMELRTEGEQEHGAGVSQLNWSPTKPVFYSAGLDGRLCEWDGRAQPSNQVPTMWGYSGIVWDMRVTNDGSALVTVSEDKVGRLFGL